MRKLRAIFILLVSVLLLLALSSCEGKSVVRLYVNDEMHAIAEYSDGTTEDLGYVGVEVEKEVEVKVEVLPPKYTVTFLDIYGQTIKAEKVYKGDGATAPQAPDIKDKSFDRWDTDFSVVTGDITVRPVYVSAAEYTVTFLDETGAVLKTQTVVHGYAAEAPSVPLRENTVFEKWDTAFDTITSDLTVRAVYRDKATYTVTFKDYYGITLGSVQVKETDTAQAPATPVREGYTFAGWSGSLSNITADKTVTAIYTLNAGENIIDLSYAIGADGTVTLTASIKGSVCFAALDGEFALPSDVTNVALKDGGSALANYKNGAVKFVLTNATNITKETVLFVVTFKSASESVIIAPTLGTLKDQTGKDVAYSVIGETVKLK